MQHSDEADNAILEYFKAYQREHSLPPSVRQLCKVAKRSHGGTVEAIRRLEARGELVRIGEYQALCYNTPDAIEAMRNLP